MKPNLLFEQLINKNNLTPMQMHEVIHDCITGQYNDLHIATFLALMRMKGETSEELSVAAQIMLDLAHKIDLGDHLIDIVGTGGDGKNTFNVSTACSFVIAASGIPVAKHGNRSVSGNSGSADLLEEAGFVLKLSDKAMQTCMQECSLAFLFAPHYHKAMHKVREARHQLGIRTLFNMLGPLINPARVKRQVVGVFSKDWLQILSSVLKHLGSERHMVLSAEDGLDEISIAAPTHVLEYNQGICTEWVIKPEDYGLKHASLNTVCVQSPKESLALIQSALAGDKGAARDLIVLNAAAAIYCAKDALSYANAIEIAKDSIDNGKALKCFEQTRLLTQTLDKENHHD